MRHINLVLLRVNCAHQGADHRKAKLFSAPGLVHRAEIADLLAESSGRAGKVAFPLQSPGLVAAHELRADKFFVDMIQPLRVHVGQCDHVYVMKAVHKVVQVFVKGNVSVSFLKGLHNHGIHGHHFAEVMQSGFNPMGLKLQIETDHHEGCKPDGHEYDERRHQHQLLRKQPGARFIPAGNRPGNSRSDGITLFHRMHSTNLRFKLNQSFYRQMSQFTSFVVYCTPFCN